MKLSFTKIAVKLLKDYLWLIMTMLSTHLKNKHVSACRNWTNQDRVKGLIILLTFCGANVN